MEKYSIPELRTSIINVILPEDNVATDVYELLNSAFNPITEFVQLQHNFFQCISRTFLETKPTFQKTISPVSSAKKSQHA